MWPTYYIPGATASPRPSVVGYACAYSTYSTNLYVDVPYPSGLQAGDLVIAWCVGLSGGEPTTLTTLDKAWIPMRCFYFGPGTELPVGPMAFRWYDGSEASTERFTWNNPVTSQQRVCIVAYRNVSQAMPFGSWTWGDYDTGVVGSPLGLPIAHPADQRSALLSVAGGGTSPGGDLLGSVQALSVGNELHSEFGLIATGQTRWGTVEHGLHHMLWYPTTNYERVNLLTRTHCAFNGSPWQKLNCTINDTAAFPDGSKYTDQTPTSTVGAERHEVYREDVVLEAGQQYTWCVCGSIVNAGFSGYYGYMTVDDGVDEIGQFFEDGAGAGTIIRNSYASGTWTIDYGWGGQFTAQGANQGAYHYVTFTAQRSGAHRLAIGVSSINGTPACTGSGGYGWDIYFTQLVPEVRTTIIDNVTSFNDTDSAITGQFGTLGRVCTKGEWTNGAQFTLELRRVNGAPTRARLYNPDQGFSQMLDAAGLSVMDSGGTTHNWTHPGLYYDPMYICNIPIYPPAFGASVPSKVYFEVTWLESTTNSNQIEVMLKSDDDPVVVSSNSGNSIGNYGYRANGAKVVNGTQTNGAYATYSTNDVIGVAWDWDNMQVSFYKNGTLQGTETISTTLGAYHYPRWPVIVTTRLGDSGMVGFKANFAGPFSYKPSGFSALDWENE